MNHVGWALLALFGYTLVPPLVSEATAEIPSEIALVVTNGMLVAIGLVAVAISDGSVTAYLTHERAPYMYAAGVALSVGILAYYRALAAGPVSVVTPIFGSFVATSALVGVFLLDEPLTARKAAGIGCALLAVYLTSLE
ncbi:EamA family transporter [Halosegnis sp.]|uniref:EamA family transporter n=1 Tax=Halosegnis sp. TaxID=2864959 RepID=UPI0035D5160B